MFFLLYINKRSNLALQKDNEKPNIARISQNTRLFPICAFEEQDGQEC